jgi:hypothetical protein
MQYYYCSTLKLDEKKEVQILEVGTCWSLSIEFIAETVRERGNQSVFDTNKAIIIFYLRKKKKKDKEKDTKRMYEQISNAKMTNDGEVSSVKIAVDKRTKAEIAFEKAREKRVFTFTIHINTTETTSLNCIRLNQNLQIYC